MVTVEGGKFKMDSTYEVEVSSFKIAKTETTFWQYNIFVKAIHNSISPPSWQFTGDNPAVYISWYNSVEYCNWLSKRRDSEIVYAIDSVQDKNNLNSFDNIKLTVNTNWQAKGYRLPTEAEWEFAARGGNLSKGFEYSGDSILTNVAWFNENASSRTHSVAIKKANEIGLFDMSGNVWEWCNDWYSEYDLKMLKNPRGAEKGPSRVVRGGSWYYFDSDCRVSFRSYSNPNSDYNYYGFRCVRYD